MERLYGIVIGPLDQPTSFVSMIGRPPHGSIARWLIKLKREGCDLQVVPAQSFTGAFVECVGPRECGRQNTGRCPLEMDRLDALPNADIGQSQRFRPAW